MNWALLTTSAVHVSVAVLLPLLVCAVRATSAVQLVRSVLTSTFNARSSAARRRGKVICRRPSSVRLATIGEALAVLS